jgi:HSP20 family protein
LRYRRLGYRYTLIHRGTWPVMPSPWSGDALRQLLGRGHWLPDADVCETARAIEIVVDLAGVDEDHLEVQLFDDALVIDGHRHPPVCEPETVYHAAGIRRGPFRLELPLPASVDAEDVRITIRKQEARP